VNEVYDSADTASLVDGRLIQFPSFFRIQPTAQCETLIRFSAPGASFQLNNGNITPYDGLLHRSR
jgi:hypothetical protein